MASTNGPDLSDAREAVEALMDDACVATFNSRSDDVLDDSTGKVIPGSPTVLYDETTTGDGGRSLADDDLTGGKCKSTKVSSVDAARLTEEGGTSIGLDLYRFSTPWDAPVLPIGTVVKITSSRRDPGLVGQELEIKRPIFGTFQVSRRYLAALRVAVPA